MWKKSLISYHTYAIVAICGWYLVQTIFFATHIEYGIPPDERFHVTYAELYSQKIGFPLQNTPTTLWLGPISTQPYFYHFTMGMLLRIKHLFFVADSQWSDVLFLRFVSIFTGILLLFLSYKFCVKLTENKSIALLLLFIESNLLMWIFLNSVVSYDNFVNLFSLLLSYQFLKFYNRRGSLPSKGIKLFFLVLLVGCLTKISFLPVAFFFFMSLLFLYRKRIKDVIKAVINVKDVVDALLVIFLVLFGVLNIKLWGGNILKYYAINPACEKVLSKEECLKWPIYARNEKLLQTLSQRTLEMNLGKYAIFWAGRMISKITGIMAHKSYTLPIYALVIYAFVFFILFSYSLFYLPYLMRTLPRIGPFILLTVFYFVVIFVKNYLTYLKLRFPLVALQGRYLFPVFPCFLTYLLVSFLLKDLREQKKVSVTIKSLILIGTFTLNNGFLYFLKSLSSEWLRHP